MRTLNLARRLSVIQQTETLGAAADLEYGIHMLNAARSGRLGSTLRFYRPQPTVAFGQRDTRLPGFEAAKQACLDHGFEPVVRRAGGRAAAYHQGCLIVDHVEPHPDSITGSKQRFGFFGDLFASAFAALGVAAAVGEIDGEYCPGEFSVHGLWPNAAATGSVAIKLAGTAQRVVGGAWFFSSVLVAEGSPPLRAVLTDVYEALELDWNPSTAGAANDLHPGLGVGAVRSAVLSEYSNYADLVPGVFDPGIARARQ